MIAYFVPGDFFTRYLDNELLSLLLMLVVGIPLYICASASTPDRRRPGPQGALAGGGPGLSARRTGHQRGDHHRGRPLFRPGGDPVYLVSIALCSLALGWLTDRLYAWSGLDITHWVSQVGSGTRSPLMVASAVVLLLLLARCYWPGGKVKKKDYTGTEPGGR